MRTRVVVLGAGFGFSKLDVMFGRQLPADARHPYRDIVKPGVRFLQSIVRAIDPVAKRVVTDHGTFDADIMVVALGADMDPAATPGLVEGGNEFYSVAGAEALRDVLPRFERGQAIIGVTSTPFKCPPAPSQPAPSRSRPRRWSPKRSTSDRAEFSAGSGGR